jgi:hypothetical protein
MKMKQSKLACFSTLLLASFASLATARAVSPVPNGDYLVGNPAEGVSEQDQFSTPSPLEPTLLLTLDNGTIKVGVETSFGGAITYLSQSGSITAARLIFIRQARSKIRIIAHSHGIQSKLETHITILRKSWRTPTRTVLSMSKRDLNNGPSRIIRQIV